MTTPNDGSSGGGSLLAGGSSGGGSPAGGGDNNEFDFHQYVPDEYKSDPTIASTKTFPDLLKTFVSAQAMLGKDKVVLPKDENDKDGWAAFNKATGVPEKPDDYKFTELKLPDGMQFDQDMMAWFRKSAHEAGVPNRVADRLLHQYADRMVAQWNGAQQAGVQQIETAKEGLKQEWGKEYDNNLAVAQRLVRTFGDPAMIQYLDESGVGNNPVVIKMFAAIGHKLGNDTLVEGSKTNGFGMTPTMAKAEINSKMADAEFMKRYNNQNAPMHKEAVEELQRLFALANPEE